MTLGNSIRRVSPCRRFQSDGLTPDVTIRTRVYTQQDVPIGFVLHPIHLADDSKPCLEAFPVDQDL